jgi:hypothetical protein
MESFIYGAPRELPNSFAEFLDPRRAAVIPIDMHEGHLADTPDCPGSAGAGNRQAYQTVLPRRRESFAYQSFTFAASFVVAVSMTSKVGSVIPRDSNRFWLHRRLGDTNSLGPR